MYTRSLRDNLFNRVEDHTNQCEDEELRDNKEREVPRDDGTIQVRARDSALEAREPAHNNWQEPAEERADSGRQYTRNECERDVAVFGPAVEEANVCGQLQVY